MLSIDQISFSYKETDALKAVSFLLEKGSVAAIVGPNGSGKSSLLKCMDRILTYQAGKIHLEDEELKTISPGRLSRKIAYVPQREYSAMPITVFDAVLLGRKPHIKWQITNQDIKIVSQMLEKLDLSEFAMRDVNSLSGGQQQRVSLARALCQQPEILLLDEPTANLDLYHQIEIMEYLTELAHEGMIVVITLHDINLAAQYCDKALMLNKGELFACGGKEIFTPENIQTLFHTQVEVIQRNDRLFILPQRKNTAYK